MKTLIAATCIAVLGAVGYFFWGEYSRYSERTAAADATANQAKYDDCLEALVAFKNGPRGLKTPSITENKARMCAPFINDWHGLPEQNRITVDGNGVHMVPLT